MEIFFISAKFGKNFLWKYNNFFVEVRQNFCGKTLFSHEINFFNQIKKINRIKFICFKNVSKYGLK
jgi:hypothetical protein